MQCTRLDQVKTSSTLADLRQSPTVVAWGAPSFQAFIQHRLGGNFDDNDDDSEARDEDSIVNVPSSSRPVSMTSGIHHIEDRPVLQTACRTQPLT